MLNLHFGLVLTLRVGLFHSVARCGHSIITQNKPLARCQGFVLIGDNWGGGDYLRLARKKASSLS